MPSSHHSSSSSNSDAGMPAASLALYHSAPPKLLRRGLSITTIPGRLLALKKGATPPLLLLTLRSASLHATLNTKIKVDKPKAWVSKFDWPVREGWTKSASLYLASMGVGLDMLNPSSFVVGMVKPSAGVE
ncbi:hypothetical protein JCM10449v2_007333 [Rhodotorula kratochvilovae]